MSIARILFLVLSSLVAGLTAPGPARASDTCAPTDTPIQKPKLFQPKATTPATTNDREPQPTFISADAIRAIKGGLSEFVGQVEAVRGTQRFTADQVRHDRNTDTVEASGSVRLQAARGDRYETDQMQLNLKNNEGHTGNSRYWLSDNLARGDARRIEFTGSDSTILRDLRYTTCPVGYDAWFLNVGELELDRKEELGTARHVWVNFHGVPIFYFPYLNFSISEQRKSGFLFPRLGYEGKHGLMLSVPYYFNLAPNFDSTLTPIWLSHRGLMWQGDFRYLTESGSGRIALESLPDDQVANEDRAAFGYSHRQTFDPFWSTRIETRYVSDINYFNDFGDHIGATSQTHLPQFAEIGYRGPNWVFTTRAANYQVIDPAILSSEKPYARLPQLNLVSQSPGSLEAPRLHLAAEWVNFDRETGPTGTRSTVAPGMSWPLIAPYGYVTPKFGARFVSYRLTDPVGDPEPSISVTTSSLDSGLFLDRQTTWGNRRVIQTLEPRLFLLRVPYRNQNGIPVFDTSPADFSFASLFRENRFSGGDRVGDTEQATLGLTSRYIDEDTGREQLRLSVGRIRYFEDQQVNLPTGATSLAGSDYAAEAIAWLPSHWHLRGAVQWSEEDDRSGRASVYAQYQPGRNRIFNVGYRSVRDELAQTDVAAEWPLSAHWTLRARSLYSLREDRNIQSYLGASYATCCWSIRFAAARRYTETRDDLNNVVATDQVNSVHLQLELNGLSRGSGYETPLKDGLFTTWRDPHNPAPASPFLP